MLKSGCERNLNNEGEHRRRIDSSYCEKVAPDRYKTRLCSVDNFEVREKQLTSVRNDGA